MTLFNVSGEPTFPTIEYDVIGQAKRFDSSSIELLILVVCAICIW